MIHRWKGGTSTRVGTLTLRLRRLNGLYTQQPALAKVGRRCRAEHVQVRVLSVGEDVEARTRHKEESKEYVQWKRTVVVGIVVNFA